MFAVIMAGGRGTRFWPLSRHSRPKQLLPIVEELSLLQKTVDRIRPVVPPKNILVVTGADLASSVRLQIPKIPAGNILLEPAGRNTAPCIGWAAMHLKANHSGDPVMAVLPSDHHIGDGKRFQKLLKVAERFARQGDALVTFAIPPTSPETGYGYIELGPACEEIQGEAIYQVKGFREKPNKRTARGFIKAGNFFWNSGMFVWKASSIIRAIERYLPEQHEALCRMVSLSRKDMKKAEALFMDMEPISIDYGVMEKSDKVFAIRGEFNWNDVGSWSTAYDLSDKDPEGNAFQSDAIVIDTKGCYINAPGKLVATIGLRDLVVVDMGNVLLLCPKDRCQEVKDIVERLKGTKKDRYL